MERLGDDARPTRLRDGHGRPIAAPLFAMLGYDPATRARACPAAGWRRRRWPGCASGPRDVLVGERASSGATRSGRSTRPGTRPDPVGLARPADRPAGACSGDSGRRPADRRRDDRRPRPDRADARRAGRRPTRIDAIVCADDGVAGQAGAGHGPPPVRGRSACAPARTAVVGDSPADLRMARAAGAGLVVGVLTGVGGRADLEPLADVVLGSVEELVGG